MSGADDLVLLPYTEDLTQAGIHFACRSFPIPDDGLGISTIGRMQRIVARKAAELGFRRHLSALGLPYENWAGMPFTAPQQSDVFLGKRRCLIQSLLISQPGQVHHLQQDPERLLTASAFIPEDQLFNPSYSDLDVFIFAIVLASATSGYGELQRTHAAGKTVYLVHLLPASWAQPAIWMPIHPITLTSV